MDSSSFIEFEHLKIKLEEIRRATNNFDKFKVIGTGGFGDVYEGVVSHSKGRSRVAIKRLNSKYGQGEHEFWKEINMLSRYTHENLISLLGYCDEGGEKLLVYEHASNGSLDHVLSSTHLTWTQRIKICLDIAKGLSYLHDDKGTHERVLHRDIKSANILLDEKWNAKVSDMGLSRIGPANQTHTAVFTNIVGTLGYLDPMYLQNGVLSKESDVYSFGVVLFEVLCGRLGTESRNGHLEIFVPTWKQKYQSRKLHEIIFQDLLHTMDPKSLGTFSDIAFHCLHESREERPVMSLVVKELEMALEFQVHQRHEDYEEMVKGAVPPINYTSLEDLKMLLSKGVFLNGGKTWFSLNDKGKHCEMISITDCWLSYPDDFAEKFSGRFYSNDKSRFKRYLYKDYSSKLKIGVRTQFLSPLITYTVNLVFKFVGKDHTEKQILTKLKHKLEGETKTWISDLADKREDGWYMAELYQVTSHQSVVDLEIIIDGHMWTSIIIESIDFRPLENAVEHQVLEDEKVDMQLISDEDDAYWEKKLPNDYQDIIKWSKDTVQWSTKKELYSILCTGFLTNNDQEWFSLDKNGKKCHMVSARATCVISGKGLTWRFLPGSRFEEVLMIQYVESHLRLVSEIKSELVSPQATYATYLVYKLPKDISSFQALQEVSYIDLSSDERKVGDSWYIYFVSPQTPVIGAKGNQNAHNPVNRPKLKGIPQQRSDGWMEVQVWEFQTATTSEISPMSLEVKGSSSGYLYGLILQGIEFRPI